jgi:tetratricopeptide (TPR) repeat protein
MNKTVWRILTFLLMSLIPVTAVLAQEEAQATLPISYRITGFHYEPQMWNNCGPATLTNALSFFGYGNDQRRAQDFLKPNLEDKNVSPWQIVDFVNTQVPEIPVFSLWRAGGNLELLKTLLANDFPVIIEQGYDPPPHDLGWMGHYLLLIGYDEGSQVFVSYDSYEGENWNYEYSHIEEFWQHFNYTYIVLYKGNREAELNALLGDDADVLVNIVNARDIAIAEAQADNNDAFAWFNIGTNLVRLAQLSRNMGDEDGTLIYYTNATVAYNQARNLGLPWRMLWYQFGPYEAYYEVAQHSSDPVEASNLYNEILRLARLTIDNCQNPDGICYIEETYYWGGMARVALGETDRALNNFYTALQINSNYQAAMEARDALLAVGG